MLDFTTGRLRGISYPRRGGRGRFPGSRPAFRNGRTFGSKCAYTETKTQQIEPDVTAFAIAGRLNLGNSLMTVENAIRRLMHGGVRKLVIDLTELKAIDS